MYFTLSWIDLESNIAFGAMNIQSINSDEVNIHTEKKTPVADQKHSNESRRKVFWSWSSCSNRMHKHIKNKNHLPKNYSNSWRSSFCKIASNPFLMATFVSRVKLFYNVLHFHSFRTLFICRGSYTQVHNTSFIVCLKQMCYMNRLFRR